MYYEISVPIKLKINLVYISNDRLLSGIRVIVSVGRNIYTGIVIREIDASEINKNLKYKNILEIVDQMPILSAGMIKLANWMSDYYKTPLGIVIDTMLPLALKHHITQKLKIRNFNKLYEDNTTEKAIYSFLKPADEWVQISVIRESIKARDFYFAIESMEKDHVIEVFRTYDEKIKPKYANYIKLLSERPSLDTLTDKQKKAYEFICEKIVHGREMENGKWKMENNRSGGACHRPFLVTSYKLQVTSESAEFTSVPFSSITDAEILLSELVNDISYSILKALKSKSFIEIVPKKIDTDLFSFPKTQKPNQVILNDEQETAIKKITSSLEQSIFKTFLLYGITGSGKTEIYIEAIKYARKMGKSALMLVPEISLTPQTVHRFYHSFGSEIAVLHSNLTDRERFMQWKLISQCKINIVIGARSAIFAPLNNIGVIIVDEEHESSYKQEHQPCYNGRDIAVKRAELEKAVVILGSATPSLESWFNSLKNKYNLLTLSTRPAGAVLPDVSIIDLKKDSENANNYVESLFSKELKNKIIDRLEKKEQIILFHNRRGYSSFLQCVTCGKLSKCPDCDISLNFHKSDNKIVCHYCGYFEETPRKCTDCGSYHFIYGSPGTEQIDSQLKILFPSAKILRMDSDTTKSKNSYNEMFEAMKNQHIDILIGTQMISKGLDFHNVTLVGVILAEITLNVPDFRSTERTFQLLTQVAGRSGRGDKKGEVIIQTRNPEHYALLSAAKQDFLGYSKKELIMRSEVFYPPYYKLARVVLSCPDLRFLKTALVKNHHLLINLKNTFPAEDFILLPFIEAPLPKIKTKYRYHFIIKSKKSSYVQKFMDRFINELEFPSKIDVLIDIDPLSLL